MVLESFRESFGNIADKDIVTRRATVTPDLYGHAPQGSMQEDAHGALGCLDSLSFSVGIGNTKYSGFDSVHPFVQQQVFFYRELDDAVRHERICRVRLVDGQVFW